MRPTIARATRRALSLLGGPQGPDAKQGTERSTPAVHLEAVRTATLKSPLSGLVVPRPSSSPNVRDEIRRLAVEVADTWANDAARRS